MTIRTQKYNDCKTIAIFFEEPFDPEVDLRQANEATAAYIAEVGAPVVRIEDVTGTNLDFNGIVIGLREATSSDQRGSFNDERVHGVFVGTQEMARLAAESFGQEQYGSIEMPFYASHAEAVEYACDKMSDLR